mmetsp:Transcript_24058/g.71601  ORF Transcript_24058/g.71601 Transcript_24058/m.71601 type:complete len:424 (-) Transcript_24058:246-1517(-)
MPAGQQADQRALGGTVATASLEEEAVGVEADAQEVHADVAEPNDEEAEGADLRTVAGVPAQLQAHVEVGGVDEPADQGPGLLGVPAPVVAPGLVRPHRAGDDADREEAEAQEQRAVGQVVQGEGQLVILGDVGGGRGAARRELHGDRAAGGRRDLHRGRLRALRVLLEVGALHGRGHGRRGRRHGLLLPVPQVVGDALQGRRRKLAQGVDRAVLGRAQGEHRHAEDGAEHQRGVGHHDHGDVHHEPVGLQRGHERRGLLELLRQREGREGHDAEGQGGGPDGRDVRQVRLRLLLLHLRRRSRRLLLGDREVDGDGGHAPGEEHEGLVHVAQGEVAGLVPAGGEEAGEREGRQAQAPEGGRLAAEVGPGAGTDGSPPPSGRRGRQQAAEGEALKVGDEEAVLESARCAMRESARCVRRERGVDG